MENFYKILVFVLLFSMAYAQETKETKIKVEIDNAQVKDTKAVKRNIKAETTIKVKKQTTAQTDTVYLSIPVEPTFGNKDFYRVKMIIETPAVEVPETTDTTILIPIKGL